MGTGAECGYAAGVNTALVSTPWLRDHLDDPDLRILDASWYMAAAGRDARAEFAAGHIPGARFFDIDEVADLSRPLPHMLPSPRDFEVHVAALGIRNDHHVVVYDGAGVFSSPRVWWTFRTFGHARVSILQGGLPAWRGEGHPLSTDTPTSIPGRYTATLQPQLVRDLEQVRALVAQQPERVVDARSHGRFMGTAPEPRPGLKSGHMPGSLNLPFDQLLTPQGALRPNEALAALFRDAGVELNTQTVTTCGSGLTAAILALALFELGAPEAAVYDGSWTEWAGRSDTEVV